MPECADSTGVEVQGQHCEGATPGYNGERRYCPYALFMGRAWVSERWREGGTDGKEHFARQLAAEVDALEIRGIPGMTQITRGFGAEHDKGGRVRARGMIYRQRPIRRTRGRLSL